MLAEPGCQVLIGEREPGAQQRQPEERATVGRQQVEPLGRQDVVDQQPGHPDRGRAQCRREQHERAQ